MNFLTLSHCFNLNLNILPTPLQTLPLPMFTYTFIYNDLVITMHNVVTKTKLAVKQMFKSIVAKTFGVIPKDKDIEVVVTKCDEPQFV